MPEHESCKGCRWNAYPLCNGTIMISGDYMNIENLRKNFECGQKIISILTDHSLVFKTDVDKKMEELEARIEELETRSILASKE